MNNIYICYASSDFFSEPTGISIISLLENNKHLPISKIFILDYGISEINKNNFHTISEKYNVPFEFIRSKEIIEQKRDELGMSDFEGSMATYSRAFIDLIIPEYVDDLVYIDSDTIVAGDISEMAYMNMGGAVMSAIIGINQYPLKGGKENSELNLLSGNTKYFACGVVRYSISNWRKKDCLHLICETCKKLKHFTNADQTVINNAIPESWIIPLHPRFNSWLHELPVCYAKVELSRGGFLSEQQIQEAIDNPTIHHYKGPLFRPWFKGSLSRANDEYFKFKAISPWKDTPLMVMDGLDSPNLWKRKNRELELKTLGPRQKIKHLTVLKIYDFFAKTYRKYYRKYCIK